MIKTLRLLQRDFTAVHNMKHTECLSPSNYWVFLEKVILKVLEEADYCAILTFKLVRSVFLSVIVLSDTFRG